MCRGCPSAAAGGALHGRSPGGDGRCARVGQSAGHSRCCLHALPWSFRRPRPTKHSTHSGRRAGYDSGAPSP